MILHRNGRAKTHMMLRDRVRVVDASHLRREYWGVDAGMTGTVVYIYPDNLYPWAYVVLMDGDRNGKPERVEFLEAEIEKIGEVGVQEVDI